MEKLFKEKKDCCGCSACANICPTNAILMKQDEEGFLYPEINHELCCNCNRCGDVCAFNKKIDSIKTSVISAYGAKVKDDSERAKSQSGGMFAAISDYILENNGVVYGAGYINHFEIAHKRATTKEQRDEFRGSKYVQSNMRDIYKNIEEDLKNNQLVYFSGTPCQVDGLSSYLLNSKVDVKNLLTTDLICYGVPSPMVWKDFLMYREKLHKGTVTSVNFRNKPLFGWRNHVATFNMGDKTFKNKEYSFMYSSCKMTRMSCFNCKYANRNRKSDITIGDFWGIENVNPNFDDNKGVSLVLLNTEKAINVFNSIKDKLNYFECSEENYYQPRLMKPKECPSDRAKFWEYYYEHDFKYLLRKYGKKSVYKKVLKKVQGVICVGK